MSLFVSFMKFYAAELRKSAILCFMDRSNARLVYKTYATLYVVFGFDNSENELAMLYLMQVFVETLDKCFSNACELDIMFNFNKVHTILDAIILGGQVIETNSSDVMKALEEISRTQCRKNNEK